MAKKIIGLVFTLFFVFTVLANFALAVVNNPFLNAPGDLKTKVESSIENIKKKIPRVAIGLGEITAIDISDGTFTAKNLKGVEITFTVDSQSKIYKNGKLVSLSDLKVGDKGAGLITYRTEDTKNIIERAYFKTNFANFAWGAGTITAITTNSFTVKNLRGKEMTFIVTSETKIYKNGKEVKLLDLKVGDKGIGVIRYIIEDGKNIAQVVRVKTNFANFAWGVGTIIAVTSNSFTAKGLRGKEMTFVIDDETKIYKNGKEATLSDLKVGDKGVGFIRYIIEDNKNIAQTVRVKTQFANFAWGAGIITAIVGNSFTVKNQKGKEMTFITIEETKFYKDGKEGSLTDLNLGDTGVGVIKYKIEDGKNIALVMRVKTKPSSTSTQPSGRATNTLQPNIPVLPSQ